uniref:HAUS augmin like complex subunit 7 n=1 Tax=Oryzias melastigma TaxID=30732 RepID=A0A3B3BX07_ORYME
MLVETGIKIESSNECVFVLQAASCPLLQGLDLREADTMLQLLCSPSELRTSIMAWIFSRYKQPSVCVVSCSLEMAALGEDLILCRRDDSDLIRGNTTPLRQLRFLEQLLTLIPNTAKPCGSCTGSEALLSELFADENLPHLRQMLEPALNPWPANIRFESSQKNKTFTGLPCLPLFSLLLIFCRALHKSSRSPFKPRKEAGDKSSSFCASSLRLAAGDLQQLMTTFCPVYESNLRAHCSREPPSFSPETDIFQRVQQLLLACNTMLSEVSVASACVEEEVKQLQTQPRYWSHGEKLTLGKSELCHQTHISFLCPFVTSAAPQRIS